MAITSHAIGGAFLKPRRVEICAIAPVIPPRTKKRNPPNPSSPCIRTAPSPSVGRAPRMRTATTHRNLQRERGYSLSTSLSHVPSPCAGTASCDVVSSCAKMRASLEGPVHEAAGNRVDEQLDAGESEHEATRALETLSLSSRSPGRGRPSARARRRSAQTSSAPAARRSPLVVGALMISRSMPSASDPNARVGEDVAALTPHRPGRAQLRHPVLHA
jgi:hypothetical protein